MRMVRQQCPLPAMIPIARDLSMGQAANSGQILLRQGAAEAVVVVDEGGDELVQARLENLVHAAVLQPAADAAGLPLRWALTAVVAGDAVKVLYQILVATRQRPRHLLVEDEQVGDQPRLEALLVDPVVG